MTYLAGTIRFKKGTHRLHLPLHPIMIAVAALGIAGTLIINRRTAFKKNVFGVSGFQEGEYVTAESNQFDTELRLPLCGPVESLISLSG